MGIFMEEVLSKQTTRNLVKENVDIESLIEENKELVEYNNELLSEMVDMFIYRLNEEYIFNEGNFFEDMKVKKEDLADPNKVKAIIKKIERDRVAPEIKDTLLDFLYGVLITIVAALPGTVVAILGVAVNSYMVLELGYLIAAIGGVVAALSFDRLTKYRSRTKKAIKKVEKALKKTDDPKMIKALKKQKDALEKNLKLFEEADYKHKKEIQDKTHYNINYNY